MQEKNEFWDVVQNAISTGNYQELSRKVKDTLSFSASSAAKPSKVSLYSKNPKGKTSGMLQMIGGFGAALAAGNVCMGALSVMQAFGGFGFIFPFASGSLIFAGILGGVGIAVGISGWKKWNFIRHFQQYIEIIGNRDYCEIEEIERKTGRKRAVIIREMKRMIGRRMFLQGHLDRKETCLIVTHEMYRQYLQLEQQVKEQEQQMEEEKARSQKIPEECKNILQEGKSYISFIRECNDRLPGELISSKLNRLELIITRIFAEVEKRPELAEDLRRFMNYYLPTTKKLIQAYYDLEQEPISSESMRKTKKEIETTLDTINTAFENLLNGFFDTKAMDISSDISVLQTMLAQEGLTEKDFNLK